MSNCSLNVRRTLVSTAAKSTLFVTTPDGSQILPNVSIAASEMTPIGLILIPELKVANSKLCKESNFSQANGEAIDGVQQESFSNMVVSSSVLYQSPDENTKKLLQYVSANHGPANHGFANHGSANHSSANQINSTAILETCQEAMQNQRNRHFNNSETVETSSSDFLKLNTSSASLTTKSSLAKVKPLDQPIYGLHQTQPFSNAGKALDM